VLKGQLELPMMDSYPAPPACQPDETPSEQQRRLLELYRGFALELHRGRYLTQLMGDMRYAEIHCQLMEDMSTLKLDQSNGRIIEFPLANVSDVYRLTKVRGKWQPASSSPQAATFEQLSVVVFCKRKLAFVFKDLDACNRFMLCLELLIWRARQSEGLPVIRASFPQCCPASETTCKVVHEEGGAGNIAGTTTGDNLAVLVQQLIATSDGSEPCDTPHVVPDVDTTPDRHISEVRQLVLDQFADSDSAAPGRRQRGCQRQSDVRRQANTQRSQAARESSAASTAPSSSFTAPAVAAVSESDSGSEEAIEI